MIDLSNINRPSSKTPFNFASSTPTVVTGNKQPVTISKYFYFNMKYIRKLPLVLLHSRVIIIIKKKTFPEYLLNM